MPRLEGKSFDSSDETRTPEKAKIDAVTIGGLTFARETLEPGWRWSSHVKPTVGAESCQRRHVKIFVSGRQRIRIDDATEMEFGPGDVAIIDKGHDGWVVGVTNRTSSSNSPRRRGRNDHVGARAVSKVQPWPLPGPKMHAAEYPCPQGAHRHRQPQRSAPSGADRTADRRLEWKRALDVMSNSPAEATTTGRSAIRTANDPVRRAGRTLGRIRSPTSRGGSG
jgi:hypothetical protein